VQVPIRERFYQGVVKSKSEKYGFVESLELKQTFGGKDIFLNPKFVGDEMFAALTIGTPVRFQYTVEKGAPRVTSCEIAGSGPGGAAPPAGRARPRNEPKSDFSEQGLSAPIPGETQTFSGVVKTRGGQYGFVESAEARAQFGKDIFFGRKEVGDQVYQQMEVGKQVVINVEVTEDGKPRAMSCLQIDGV
jgi:cold shock CspA family protein